MKVFILFSLVFLGAVNANAYDVVNVKTIDITNPSCDGIAEKRARLLSSLEKKYAIERVEIEACVDGPLSYGQSPAARQSIRIIYR